MILKMFFNELSKHHIRYDFMANDNYHIGYDFIGFVK